MGVLAPQYISNCWRGQIVDLVISEDIGNVNLLTLAAAAGYSTTVPSTINVYVEPGVRVGSSSTAEKAFRTGAWPSGSIAILTNDGLIAGKGGQGGASVTSTGAILGGDGEDGGDAIHAEIPLFIYNNSNIGGGGGGGAGSNNQSPNSQTYDDPGGAGGGGAGFDPGTPGTNAAVGATAAQAGQPGTDLLGGAGGRNQLGDGGGLGGYAGDGGDLGQPGGEADGSYGGAPGQPGYAITGTAPVTLMEAGDIYGPISIAAYPTSAVVADATPSKLTVTFSKDIASADFAAGIEITIDDVAVTGLASATGSPSDTIEFTFDETVAYGDIVEWSYDAETGDYVDEDTFAVLSFTDAAVTNNVEASLVPPVITAQPENATVTEGEDADFSVTATGAVSYQWYADAVPIGGETGASLTLSAVALAADGTEIHVVVSNADGDTSSDVVTLTVNEAIDPPVITAQPSNATVTEPAAANFSVTATGADTYQWYMDDAVMVGQTANTLNTGPTVLADDGTEFYCVVSNEGGDTQSDTVTLTVNAGAFSVPIQSPNFGYNQQAGAGVHTFEASAGEIASIGTPTGDDVADFTISLTDGVVSISASGTNLPNGPYALTVPCYSGAGETGSVVNVPVNIDPDVNTLYVLADDTELTAALTAVGVAGGKTVKIRNGSFSTTALTGNAFLSEVIVTAENPVAADSWNVEIQAPDKTGTDLRSNDNLTITNIEFTPTGTASAFGDAVTRADSCDTLKLDQCYIHGDDRNPNDDFTLGHPQNFVAINMTNPNIVTNLTITRCLFTDLQTVITLRWAGDVDISNNTFARVYGDYIKLLDDQGDPFSGTVKIEENLFTQPLITLDDPGPPHQDCIQVQHRATGNWPGIKINRNIFMTGDSRGNGWQAVFSTSINDAAGYYLEDAEFNGNLFCMTEGSHCITVGAATDCKFIGNTLVKQDPTEPTGKPATLTVSGSGTNIVQNNIAESFDLDGSVTASNNIALGLNGATIPYTDVFAGPTFQPANRTEMLAKYSMKANGPADVDDSGGPSLHDAGAVGTGYITWGDERSPSGWAVDTDYEEYEGGGGGGSPAVLSSPTATATGIRSMAGTVSTDTLTGSVGLYQVTLLPVDTAPSGTQIIAGTDGDDAAADHASNQPVTATGVQDIEIDFLEPGTDYVTYYCHLTDEGPSNVVSDSFTTETPVVRDTFVREPYGALNGTLPTVGIEDMEWLTVVGGLTTAAPGKVSSSAPGSFDASRLDTSVGGPDVDIYWIQDTGDGDGNFTFISARADSAVDVNNYIFGGVMEDDGDYFLELTEVVSGVSTEIGSVQLAGLPPAGTIIRLRLEGTNGLLRISSEDAEIAVDDLNITTGNFTGPATGNSSGNVDEITNFEVALIS